MSDRCLRSLYIILLKNGIQTPFFHKKINIGYTYFVFGHKEHYFVKEHFDSNNKCSEEDVYHQHATVSSRHRFRCLRRQLVGIQIGTNYAIRSQNISELIRSGIHTVFALSRKKKQFSCMLNFTYRYIDDLLSIANPDFENYIGQMYPTELDIKDTPGINTASSYLNLLQSLRRDCLLRTFIYNKSDDLYFHVTSCNIPSPPTYGVFISQFIRYVRA